MTHEERVWHHEMETCEGIREHAERIAKMEEFLLALHGHIYKSKCASTKMPCVECNQFEPRGKCIASKLIDHMDAMGIEWRKD